MPPTRIIPVDDIPTTLWDKRALFLPPCLVAAYQSIIKHHQLHAMASARDPNHPPVGGFTKEEAQVHFAQAFDGSCARVSLALIDPKAQVGRVADAMASLFAGGKIAILDVPCGAGAFFLSVLSSVAELRSKGVVPRQPLDVLVLGGDINPHAAVYANDLHCHVSKSLEDQAIFVEFEAMSWDVCDDVSTAELLKRFLAQSAVAERRAVVISNFSAFLRSTGNWKKAEPQLKNIFLFCADAKTSAIWIEPRTTAATHDLRTKVLGVVREKWASFMQLFGRVPETDAQEQTETDFMPALGGNATIKARLAVMRFDLRSRASG